MSFKRHKLTIRQKHNPNGLTMAEIADLLGITRQRVEQILNQALHKMKKELLKQGFSKQYL